MRRRLFFRLIRGTRALLELIAYNVGLCPGVWGSRPMADIVYHLRQASTLTRYARLTRNRERAAELLQLAEQHKKLAEQETRLLQQNQEIAVTAREQ
jgi:hypothetical protein